MNIRYHNTFRDIMTFQFYHCLHSAATICVYGASSVLIYLALIQAVPQDLSPIERVVSFIILAFIAFIAVAVMFTVLSVLGIISRRNKTLLTEHTVTLDDVSFTEETIYNKSDCKWASVQKLARTKKYIFIYLAQHLAFVIPRRAFRDQGEWDSFYEFCKLRVGKTP